MSSAAEEMSFADVDWKSQESGKPETDGVSPVDGDAEPSPAAANDQEDEENIANALQMIDELVRSGRDLGEQQSDAEEKADDAADFGDISDDDDDLPDEEPASMSLSAGLALDTPALTDAASHDTDSLFGDGDDDDDDDDLFGDRTGDQLHAGDSKRPGEDEDTRSSLARDEFPRDDSPPVMSELEQLRLLNFNQDPAIPEAVTNHEELLEKLWPHFKPGAIPNWSELLPPRHAYYMPKEPLKPPKPLHPTRLALEIAPDQEKAFRSTLAPAVTTDREKIIMEAQAKGLVAIVNEEDEAEAEPEEVFDWSIPEPEDEVVKGVRWADLVMSCNDWSKAIDAEPPALEEPEEELDDWERQFLRDTTSKRKALHDEVNVIEAPQHAIPSLSNYSEALEKVAARPILDLNDPHLLLDTFEVEPKRRRLEAGLRRTGGNSIANKLKQRFNLSNDEAYDALKENHQSKVRATVSNMAIEHSMPAVKLQWPYYRVEMRDGELRTLHRPSLKFAKFLNRPIHFTKLGNRKRKELKGMTTQQIFAKTADLSLADHWATAMLLEHTEEVPTVLPNFGMGSKIVNYYRKKNDADLTRPVLADRVGDVHVLMPQDTSPFGSFGFVDPGELVRCYQNELFKAPIFKHDPKSGDFLICRNTTGMDGTVWHLRNIDHVFAVGQHLPQQVVPTRGARRITTIAKNRMKMLSYRLLRHDKKHTMRIQELTPHIQHSEDSSNRQKMKDFIFYDKNQKVWRMKDGEQIPTEHQMRGMIKPEDACIVDACMAGVKHLRDAGIDVEDERSLMAEGDDVPIEVALAPWRTTKNFAEASSGKAMLTLHGDGDPTGVGLGMAFIKISMKGGYIGALQGPAATSSAAIEAEIKANGGHKYNVKTQEKLYNAGIRDIWDKQMNNLADVNERAADDGELRAMQEDDQRRDEQAANRSTNTPALDDSMSQISAERRSEKVLKIIRTYTGPDGKVTKKIEIVRDRNVYRCYEKRCAAIKKATNAR